MPSKRTPLTARPHTQAGLASLAERRAGMDDAREGSGVELVADHLYKVTGSASTGRKYRIDAITDEKVLATEGLFEKLSPRQTSSEDPWGWAPAGPRWMPLDRLRWVRDVGRIPEVGEPRFRFRWGMEPG